MLGKVPDKPIRASLATHPKCNGQGRDHSMTLMSAQAVDSTSFETIHAQQKYIWSLLQMSMINHH
jgi:hypothetical protein